MGTYLVLWYYYDKTVPTISIYLSKTPFVLHKRDGPYHLFSFSPSLSSLLRDFSRLLLATSKGLLGILMGDIPSQGEILPVNKDSAHGNGHTRSFRNHLLRTGHELSLLAAWRGSTFTSFPLTIRESGSAFINHGIFHRIQNTEWSDMRSGSQARRADQAPSDRRLCINSLCLVHIILNRTRTWNVSSSVNDVSLLYNVTTLLVLDNNIQRKW
jgi:hypothetical protein